MGFKQGFFQWAGRMMFERPVRSQSVVDLASTLSSSGDEVRERIAGKEGTPANVARLRHIIGIERWGQRRLRVFLGDPLEPGGHHPHKPTDTDWSALQTELASTRADTVALAGQLATTDLSRTVPHDQFGPLTVRGWLAYLQRHARMESKLMR
jgi:hypothetical protein